MKIVSPYFARRIIPTAESSFEVQPPSEDLAATTVAIEEPKTLLQRFWYGVALAFGVFPGAFAAGLAANAFDRGRIVTVQIAPTTKPSPNLTPRTPSPAPTKEAPKPSQEMTAVTPKPGPSGEAQLMQFQSHHTILVMVVVFVAQTLASETLKAAGKDLWEKIKQIRRQNNPPEKPDQQDHSATIDCTVQLGHEKASASLDGPFSDITATAFATQKPEELYAEIKLRRNPAAPKLGPKKKSRRTRRRTLTGKDVVRVKLRFTPKVDSKA